MSRCDSLRCDRGFPCRKACRNACRSVFHSINQALGATACGTAYRHPTYRHEQPKWCCRLTGFPSLLFTLTLLHGLVVLAPTAITKEVETFRFQV